MSTLIKRNNELVTIAGNIVQKVNARWFLCPRSVVEGVEYYTVPQEAQDYFRAIGAYTLYSFGFDTPNTTTNPKLVYGNQVLDIKDFTTDNNQVVIGQLKGVFDMFTQNLDTDPEIFFVGNTHKDAPMVLNNISVAANDFTVDSTYTDYGYKGTIAISGINTDYLATVIFSGNDATSGNYCPVAETYNGGIYIWSKVNTAITIPTIVLQKIASTT